jgi:geranylgeranyl diphosphate synthase type II
MSRNRSRDFSIINSFSFFILDGKYNEETLKTLRVSKVYFISTLFNVFLLKSVLVNSIKFYTELVNEGLKNFSFSNKPKSLYDPIKYILDLEGKRIRPILTLMSCNSFGLDPKEALSASLSLECFHNFTLMHDDIMDSALTRRGEQTVHVKWNSDRAILSGDAMLIFSYKLLESYDLKTYFNLNKLLNKTALEVCEGQQYDIDFETKLDIDFNQYLEMIRLKTAVLVGAALQMGAIVANASDQDQERIYNFGINLGLAFQLQDDLLDVFGDSDLVGKKNGGDILENKKTILFHMTRSNATKIQIDELDSLFNSKKLSSKLKISKVTTLFKATKADTLTSKLIKDYTTIAIKYIDDLSIEESQKEEFKTLSKKLMGRQF